VVSKHHVKGTPILPYEASALTPPANVSVVENKDICLITTLRGRISRHPRVRIVTRREPLISPHIMER
jgi:hypothetical protein